RYARILARDLDRPKKAIKILRQSIEMDPEYAAAHYQLAVLLHAQGNYDAALKAYNLAAKLDPAYSTQENDAAFAIPVEPEVINEPKPSLKPQFMTGSEASALTALKENIAQLEAMITQREAEAKAEQEALAAAKLAERPGTGLTVLISGATSGIGRATARRFAEAGYRLLLTGRRKARLVDLKKELTDEHEIEVRTLNFDVRDKTAVDNSIKRLPKTWRNIDILINNAGKAKGFDPIHEGKLDHWDEMIDTNLRGLLYLTRAISPRMVERQTGFIINVCSTAGKEVYPNGNVYCATKHAVDALTKAMRLDLVSQGIRVGQVSPAHVEETEFASVRFDGDESRAEKVYEGFQPLTSADVAASIYFMANQPAHVNILDVVLQGKQQASSTMIDRSGRRDNGEEE
ncbi:MAG: SDR family NAD(P)-dependent oxidoreductase, partial [Bacteroidota bacterium]